MSNITEHSKLTDLSRHSKRNT